MVKLKLIISCLFSFYYGCFDSTTASNFTKNQQTNSQNNYGTTSLYGKSTSDIEPNDEYNTGGKQWGLNGTYGINAPKAWGYTTGKRKIRVGIIDSGIYNHIDLKSNLVSGYDFVNNSTITYDDLETHGTHVAGIIGAVSNNSIGIAGVNWNVQLVPLQTVQLKNNEYVHQWDNIVKAINYATNLWGTENQIDILNFSISQYGIRTDILPIISKFPGLFVWSAGNRSIKDSCGDDVDEFFETYGFYDLPNLISVGAINSKGEKSNISNYSFSGNNINIYAPGEDIYSTIHTKDDGDTYISKWGTSMAAPFISGTAALLLSIDNTLSAAQLKQIILNNADNITINVPIKNKTTKKSLYVKKLNAGAAVSSIVKQHTHNFNLNYTYVDSKQHRVYCDCGTFKLMGHSVSSSWDGSTATKCLLCGGKATIGYVGSSSSLISLIDNEPYIVEYFGNGSYLLSDGIYVISDNDIEDLINGLLDLPINN